MQSPELRPLRFAYTVSVLTIERFAQWVRITPAPGNVVYENNQTWELFEIVVHSPSEHKISGEAFDAEIQFIHRKQKSSEIMHLSIFANEGSKNEQFAKIVEQIPKHAKGRRVVSGVDLRQLIPNRKNYFTYSGSETKPPCQEGIRWVLLKQSITLGPSQLDATEHRLGPNTRPIQKIHQRIPLRN